LVDRVKRLESEMGKLRKTDRDSLIQTLVSSATQIEGVALVVSEVGGEDASGLRELAQKVRDRLTAGPAVVVLGAGTGGKAQLAAASTPAAIALGVTAPALLETGAKAIGGGAGGKDGLAMAGGANAAALSQALDGVAARLRELVSAS
jgi:alanyl-tRNA synthetase